MKLMIWHHAITCKQFLWHYASISEMAFSQYASRMNTPDKKPLAKEADKYIVRLPAGMREQIAAAAKASNRSMNAEIVARLESSFSQNIAAQQGWEMDQFVESLAAKLAVKLKSQ